MQFNDQKLAQFTFFPQAYQTNLTASHKYLQRDHSPNKAPQLHSSQSQRLYHNSSSILNSHQKTNRQSTARNPRGASIPHKQADIKVPPIKSLNSEDKEKLIATLTQQIKLQHGQIAQLETALQESIKKLDVLQQERQTVESKHQQVHKTQQIQEQIQERSKLSSQVVLQINSIRREDGTQYQGNDCLQIINDFYEEQIDLDMAIKWREARLKFTFFEAFARATKLEKRVRLHRARKDKLHVKQLMHSWRTHISKRQLLTQFNIVSGLRLQIQYWVSWKNFLQSKKKAAEQNQTAQHFHVRQLLQKGFTSFKLYYEAYNYPLENQKQIDQQFDEVYNQNQKLKVFRAWQLWHQKSCQLQSHIAASQKRKLKLQKQWIIYVLKENAKFYKQSYESAALAVKKLKIKRIFNQIRGSLKQNVEIQYRIALNRSHFSKLHCLHKWRQLFLEAKSMKKLEALAARQCSQLILRKVFATLKRLKSRRQKDEILFRVIKQKCDQKRKTSAFLQIIGVYADTKTGIISEQQRVIQQQEIIVQEQQTDSVMWETQYNNLRSQLRDYEEQLANYKRICDDSSTNEQELMMQIDHLKKELMIQDQNVDRLREQNEEFRIQSEQLHLANLQIKELRYQLAGYQQTQGNKSMRQSQIYNEQDTIKKQLDLSNKMVNEQKFENQMLKSEYQQLVSEYEGKLKEIERYYVDLCEKQKLQIERLMRENQQLMKSNSQNLKSKTKLMEELNLLHGSFGDESMNFRHYSYMEDQKGRFRSHQCTSPQSNQYSPPSKLQSNDENKRIKEEAQTLREDIKRRLASLKTQMDQHQ